jgi:hypothetical protein
MASNPLGTAAKMMMIEVCRCSVERSLDEVAQHEGIACLDQARYGDLPGIHPGSRERKQWSLMTKMCDDHCLEVLLPQLAGVTVERVESRTAELRIWARPKADRVPCPGCGGRSARVHRRYRRRLADLAVGGRQVMLMLQVRVFVCQDQSCPVRRFAEQVEGLTAPYARHSGGLREVLEQIGLALAGRAGVRLAARLGLPISRNTVLRLVRRLPERPPTVVRVLGVDDFEREQRRAVTRRQTHPVPAGLLPAAAADGNRPC